MRNKYYVVASILVLVTFSAVAQEFEKVDWVRGGVIKQYYQSDDASRLIAVGDNGGIYEYHSTANSWARMVIDGLQGDIRRVVPLSNDTVIILSDKIVVFCGGNSRAVDVAFLVYDIAVFGGYIYALSDNYKSYRIEIKSGSVQELGNTPDVSLASGDKLGTGIGNVFLLGWMGIYMYSNATRSWEKKTESTLFMGATNNGVTKIYPYRDGIITAAGDAVIRYAPDDTTCDTLFQAGVGALFSYSAAGDTLYVAEKISGFSSKLYAVEISTRGVREIDYSSSGAVDVMKVGYTGNVVVIFEGIMSAYASYDGGTIWEAADKGIEEVLILKLAVAGDRLTVVGLGVINTGFRYRRECKQHGSLMVTECAQVLGMDTLLLVDANGSKMHRVCGYPFYIDRFVGTASIATKAGEIYKTYEGVLGGTPRVGSLPRRIYDSVYVICIGEIENSPGVIFMNADGSIYTYTQDDGITYIVGIRPGESDDHYLVAIDDMVYYCSDAKISIYDRVRGTWSFVAVPDNGRVIKIISTATDARYLFTSERNLYALDQGGLMPVGLPLDAEIADIASCEGYVYLAYRYDGLYAMELDVASVQDLEASPQVDVYPLPARDQIDIHVKDGNGYVLDLYSLHTGQLVKREVRWSTRGYVTLGLNDVNTGLYMLEILPAGYPGQVVRKKIVVKK